MTLKISRYILIFISIISMSIFFPKLYWLILETPESHTKFFYSCVENDFVLSKHMDKKTHYKTSKGKTLSKTEYYQALPFLFFRNLVSEGIMPDSIKGVKMDPHEITMTNFNAKLFEYDIDAPDYGLYPLFESNNGISNPLLPEDFFRFSKHHIEFIIAETNKPDVMKSRKFTEALSSKYFMFPPKVIAGNTSVRKSVDEGYFIVDALNHFFNLKMTNGEPVVTIIPLPKEVVIKHIQCVEMRSREFLAIIVSEQDRLYLLMSAGYLLEELPVDKYNPKVDNLRIQGDMFYKTISIIGPSYSRNTVIDTDYELVDYIEENWVERKNTKKGRFARSIFPFELRSSKSKQGYKRLHIVAPTRMAFNINFLLASIFFIFNWKKRRLKHSSHPLKMVETLLIFLFGMYGLIACTVLKK